MRKVEPKTDDYDRPMSSKEKKVKVYPQLRLDHESFPETKKWEVGKEYTIKLKLKMTGLSISRFQNDSEFYITGFEINK